MTHYSGGFCTPKTIRQMTHINRWVLHFTHYNSTKLRSKFKKKSWRVYYSPLLSWFGSIDDGTGEFAERCHQECLRRQ